MRTVAGVVLLSLGGVGCGGAATFHPATPADVAAGSPLGPSYILVPLPNDDDSLLGRVLLDVPDNGRSLDEVSRPNECADKLAPRKAGPLASTFEDGQELAAGGRARAALGAFGFEGDVQRATHFYYKLEVDKRVSQIDTIDYTACCKDKGTCGYGFISALIYGDGQYATATEDSAEGSVSIPVAGGAGGFVRAKILHKRKVHGYLAALVTVTDTAKSKAISVLGDPAAAGIALDEQSLPEQVRARFEAQKILVATCLPPTVFRDGVCVAGGALPSTATSIEFDYVFRDGNGPITENEFARRYASLTGTSDLEPANQNRRTALLVAGASTLAVFGAIGVYGFLNIRRPCNPSSDYVWDSTPSNHGGGDQTCFSDMTAGTFFSTTYTPPAGWASAGNNNYYDPHETTNNWVGVAAATFGTGGAVVGGIMLAVALGNYDGSTGEHVITKFDADLYAARYNRVLLRQTIQQTRERMQHLSGKIYAPSVTVMPVVSPGFTGIVGTF